MHFHISSLLCKIRLKQNDSEYAVHTCMYCTFYFCHPLSVTTLSVSMGSRGVAAGANSCLRVRAGNSLDKSPAHHRALHWWAVGGGSVSCSRTLQHAALPAELQPPLYFWLRYYIIRSFKTFTQALFVWVKIIFYKDIFTFTQIRL